MLNSMQIASLYAKIGADTKQFDSSLKQSEGKLQSFGRTAGSAAGAVGKSLLALGAVSATAMAAVAGAVTNAGFKFNNLSQQGTIAFETMLGSADKAKAFMAELQTFAAKTPFEFAQLMEASQKMLAMGFKENEILPTLTAIGDAVSALGGGQEKIDRVTVALGQLKAKGKTSAEEMMQLTEAGIPAWEMLAQSIGVSIPEAMKMVTAGAIDADTTIAAVVSGMQDRFGGLMSKQAETFGGLRSTLSDTFQQLSGKVTKPLFDAVTRGMKSLVDLTNTPAFAAGVERFTARIAELVAKTEEWVRNNGPRAIAIFKGIGQTIGGWLTVIPNAYRKFREIVDNVNDPGLMRTVVRLQAAFAGLGKILGNLARPFKDAFSGLFQSLMVARGSGWAGIFDVITQRLKKAVNDFGQVMSEQAIPFILEQLRILGEAMRAWIVSVDWWSKIKEWAGAFWGWAVGLWELVQPHLADFWNWLTSWVTDPEKRQTLWNGIVRGWDVLTEWAQSIWNWAAPHLQTGWNWLSGWFTDPAKRQQLWDGIAHAWDVVSNWAIDIWTWAAPHLSAGWKWLTSWFTDSGKRRQLWDGIKAVWDVVSNWAIDIWNWAAPHLTAGWKWLTSWFTDPTKSKQMWDGIVSMWNWLTGWAEKAWNWMEPKLIAGWQWLTGWITDPTKKQELWRNIVNTWTGFTDWAAALWGDISPGLASLWTNLKRWIDENVPNLGTWIDAFVKFAAESEAQWAISFPNMRAEFTGLRVRIEEEAPLIADAMGRLWKALFGEPEGGGGGGMVRALEGTFEAISRTLGTIVSQVRVMIDILATAVEATKAFASGDFGRFMELSQRSVDLWREFGSITGGQWDWFTNFVQNGPGSSPLPGEGVPQNNLIEGRAFGGRFTRGGLTWVGERGPELVNLPGGSHVYTNAQSRAMAGGGRLDLYVHGESSIPADRSKIRELARMLQQELQLSGARVLLA